MLKRSISRPFTLENQSVFSVHESFDNSDNGNSYDQFKNSKTAAKKSFANLFNLHTSTRDLSVAALSEPYRNLVESEKFSKTWHNSKRKADLPRRGLKVSNHLQKNHKSKSRGRKKNLDENQEGQITGIMRNYDLNTINLNAPTTNHLCPDWPSDSKIVASCSNGREIRSVCSVGCVSGYKLQKGSPTKRRCRNRRPSDPDSLRPLWSGRDDQFVCGE